MNPRLAPRDTSAGDDQRRPSLEVDSRMGLDWLERASRHAM
jgi:hypothetical protein